MLAAFAAALFAVFPGSQAPKTKTPPPPGSLDGVKRLLAVPAWYVNYDVTIKGEKSVSDSGENGSSSTRVSYTLHFTGAAKLGTRGQGGALVEPQTPSPPSIPAGRMPTAKEQAEMQKWSESLQNMAENSATWMQLDHQADEPEQTDKDVQNDLAKLKKDWTVSASLQNSYETTSNTPEKVEIEQNAEKRIERVTAQGSGQALVTGGLGFQVDAAAAVYHIALPWKLTDLEEKLVRGERYFFVQSGANEPTENKEPTESGFYNGGIQITDSVHEWGDDVILDGKLPSGVAAITGTRSFKVRIPVEQENLDGELIFRYTASPFPPTEEELVIVPPPHYEDWRPTGGDDEKDAGDWVPVEVRLQKKGGGAPAIKARKITYRLIDTSKEPGVCMNWPKRVEEPTPCDLQFDKQVDPNITVSDEQRQIAVQEGSGLTGGKVVVASYDFGAFGALAAVAELENGSTVETVVSGRPGETTLELPFRKEGSKIAASYIKSAGVDGKSDDADDENEPVGDGFKGDGLTLYEEYRGFREDGRWIGLPSGPKPSDTGAYVDPSRKDLFVFNSIRSRPEAQDGIEIFRAVTELNVHSDLRMSEMSPDRIVNYRRAEGPHSVDQHALYLYQCSGEQHAAQVTGQVGTPGTAEFVEVPAGWRGIRGFGGAAGALSAPGEEPYYAATVAHEMLHGCKVYHHGELDEDRAWVLVKYPKPHLEEGAVGEVTLPDGSKSIGALEPRTEITVLYEDGTPVPLTEIFDKLEAGQTVDVSVGMDHGQHSGHEACLMRYDCANAYISRSNPNVRYWIEEPTGLGICESPAGTGINDPARKPQSRYSTAAPNRGDCKHQIRVNDKGEEPHR